MAAGLGSRFGGVKQLAQVGPDSLTNAWSIFVAGNPLPSNVSGCTNAMLTGACDGSQL